VFQAKFIEKNLTHILCPVSFSPGHSCRYEIMWKNLTQPDGPQWTI